MADESRTVEEPKIEELDKLIAKGKQKGFLTYDEVNDALPSDLVIVVGLGIAPGPPSRGAHRLVECASSISSSRQAAIDASTIDDEVGGSASFTSFVGQKALLLPLGDELVQLLDLRLFHGPRFVRHASPFSWWG